MTISDSLTVPARTHHTATVIFLHGLNTTGYTWQDMATTFTSIPTLSHIKWILPHAPRMPVMAKGGEVVHSWYNIFDWDYKLGEDEAGLLASSAGINEMIRQEIASGIPADRIVLGGFSQGGAMSLVAGLASEFRLAGIINLSGRLTMKAKLPYMITEHTKSLPIFWGHGQQDVVVKYAWTEASVEFLKNDLGICVATKDSIGGIELHSYKGLEHGTCEAELEDLRDWVSKVIPAL